MTHADIYEKFMIEYDKENVTTSYPSLTEYEIATLLDKAYLALIAQKFTGNNMRRVPFEGDEKAVEDLQPLVQEGIIPFIGSSNHTNLDLISIEFNKNEVMYIIHAVISDLQGGYESAKQIQSKYMYKFMSTVNNKPWSRSAIYSVRGNKILLIKGVFIDNVINKGYSIDFVYTYIKYPQKFADKNKRLSQQTNIDFELSDSMAEELINLALVMSTEIVESPRMQTKAQLRGLES